MGESSEHTISDNTVKEQGFCKNIRESIRQQNGILEGDGKNIMNVTRCLLNKKNLPKKVWEDIAATAVFFIHRLPHSGINGAIPYNNLFGKHAKPSYLRIIGSSVFVYGERHTNQLEEEA